MGWILAFIVLRMALATLRRHGHGPFDASLLPDRSGAGKWPRPGKQAGSAPQVAAPRRCHRDETASLLPPNWGRGGWGKRAMILSHRNAASPSLTSPTWAGQSHVRIETRTKANRLANKSTQNTRDSFFVHGHAIPLPTWGRRFSGRNQDSNRGFVI